MNRRYYLGIASVLYFLCFVSACGVVSNAFEIINLSHNMKIASDAVLVLSGYTASFFYCLNLEGKKAADYMRVVLFLLFALYLIMLVDFTLIDDSFGRNIFNFLSWDKEAFKSYVNESTNFIPFATVKLFIKGYFEDNLTFRDTVINLLGNFAVLMPITLLIPIFFENIRGAKKIFITVILTSLAIELLQFLFLTGSTDIDDIILNTSGAMLCYYLLRREKINRIIARLTFGLNRT